MNNEQINQYLVRHETFLQETLAQAEIPAKRIKDAMAYALFPPGKRIRPLLVYLAGQLVDVPSKCLDVIAAAIELTHCYSLVHDDLPAMDNDDFRRGKASCHRAFDEATAILVGDGMQALAIEILLTHLPQYIEPTQIIAVVSELCKASGLQGMVSGQSLDLSELCNANINDEKLRTIHSLKTGKLILACVNMALAASVSTTPLMNKALRDYAYHLGLVFQMQDDYLDEYAPANFLGKGRASDISNQKITFARLYTQSTLLEMITNHYNLAKEALFCFDNKAHDLLALTHYLQQRSDEKFWQINLARKLGT